MENKKQSKHITFFTSLYILLAASAFIFRWFDSLIGFIAYNLMMIGIVVLSYWVWNKRKDK